MLQLKQVTSKQHQHQRLENDFFMFTVSRFVLYCVPCVSRLPPVSFYRYCTFAWNSCE